jgi:hypothetical protein
MRLTAVIRGISDGSAAEKLEVAKMTVMFTDPTKLDAEKPYSVCICIGGHAFRVVIE